MRGRKGALLPAGGLNAEAVIRVIRGHYTIFRHPELLHGGPYARTVRMSGSEEFVQSARNCQGLALETLLDYPLVANVHFE